MRGPVVQPLVPPVLDIREHVAQRRPVAGQFVGDHHPRHIREALEQLPEEAHGRALVAPGLHQDVEHVAALVYRPPELVLRAIDADEHRVQVPLIARARASSAHFVRLGLAELLAPLPARLVRDDHPALGEQFLHVAVAQREAEGAPDRVADDRGWEAMALVAGDCCVFFHAPSIAHPASRAANRLP